MISQSAEYSLRAVACLAANVPRPLTIRQIADAARIPAGYLAKILSALARAGIVASQRGVNGGFVLSRDPRQLTLLDVVRVADPSHRIRCCPLGLAEHREKLCDLHCQLDLAAAQAEEALARKTIADVMNGQPVIDVCGTAANRKAAS